MEPTEKELEDRLRELGTRLASPPSDVGELLFLLDQTEIYLSRVEQSPSTSMSEALRPAMNSLITKEFLNHPEADVKVFVAACINEIIRVTAPDAPYNDDLMKEIFTMIVDSFEKLDDMSGCLYSKRVCILEIMAKVCSCVIMLDLECDDLILRMFKHFLRSIRPDHPINVFFSMETIMTLILEESEDISQELLICLLSNVQNSEKGVIPVARRLAEKVISNCSMKLKPYILVAVQSMGTYLRDYSDIVASICQGTSVALEQNEVDANKLSERTVSDELPKGSEKLDDTIKALNNGAMPLGNGNVIIEPISQEFKPDNSFQCRNDVAPISENNSLGSITEKPGNELNFQYIETKSSSMQLDASDSSRVDGDKEASASTSRRAGRKSQTTSSKSDNASDMAAEAEVFLESKREAELRPLEGLVGDNTCVNSASPTNNSPDSGLPIRRVTNLQFGDKKSTSHKPAPSAGKKTMFGIATVKEGPPAILSERKDHCLVSISDGKPSHDSAKMSLADNATAEVAAAGNSVGKSLREEQKEVASVVADANSSENQWKSNINQPKAKGFADKDISAEPCLKEMMVSSKASREANNVENHWVKFAGGSLIKKGRREDPREYNIDLEVVGREIEVWWPDDKMFYKGVIDAFDPVTGKHRVVYDDGDVEILLLRNERWNYIDYKNFERRQENDIASPDSSSQVPRRKRRGSSGRRKAARGSRNKSGRKSIPLPIQQSGDGNSTQITSELGTSLNETTPETVVRVETKPEEPSQITIIKDNNISSKFVSDRKDILASVDDSFGRKSKAFIDDLDDKSVDAQTEAKLDGKSKGGSKLDGEASQISRVLNDEGINVESSETKDSDKATESTCGLVMDSDEELKGEDTVRRRKRKGSLTATDTDLSAIKNLDDLSQNAVANASKRRKK